MIWGRFELLCVCGVQLPYLKECSILEIQGYGNYRLTGLLLLHTPLDFSPISRSWELKLTKLAVLLNALTQWCTS